MKKIEHRTFLEIEFQHPTKLDGLPKDLPFLPKRMKIGNIEKL